MTVPSRIGVVGSEISICDMDGALAAVETRLQEGEGGYVCFTNVHAVVEGRRDERFRTVTNGSFLSLADGKPVYWAGRARGASSLGHVPGPDFFGRALHRFRDRRHFFYGSTPRVLEQLTQALQRDVPGLQICGMLSPPFRQLTDEDRRQHYATIRDSKADFVWVGLGAPKQEHWMAGASAALVPGLLFGVGAAFDFHAGTVRRAPAPLGRMGLEWLYRVCQEPGRLWKRYLVTNSLFLGYLVKDWLKK